jgi:RecA/RadA recombinase
MSLKDVLGKTTKDLTDLSKKKDKKAKKPLFSFGHENPTFADDDGAGDVKLWIPSGITMLDYALGGGLPVGRISELYSDHESEGKTTIALHFARSVQQIGGAAIWLESESAIDKPRAKGMGLDLGNMVIWTPDTLEDGFRFIDKIVQNIDKDKQLKNKPTLIVWDTLAMARTEAERDGDAFRDGIGAGPRATSTALKNYAQELYRYNVHLLLVNQSYTNINSGSSYTGPDFETPGGKRVKFASTIRLHLRKGSMIGDKPNLGAGDERLGIMCWATTTKNKMALAHRRVPLALYGKTGLNDIMTMAHAWNDGPYKWEGAIKHHNAGRYFVAGLDKKPYWHEIEAAVAASPDVLGAWRAHAFDLFPVHPSRKLNPDGWFERTKNYDDTEFLKRKGSVTMPTADLTTVPTGPSAAEIAAELKKGK